MNSPDHVHLRAHVKRSKSGQIRGELQRFEIVAAPPHVRKFITGSQFDDPETLQELIEYGYSVMITVEEDNEIKLRWLEIDGELIGKSIVQEAIKPGSIDDLKMKTLERLKIEKREGEPFGHAWLRAMSEENGLPFTLPVHEQLMYAITGNVSVYRFYFWLT